MSSSVGRQRFSRNLSRVVAWATVPLFLIGVGSMIWLEHEFGLGGGSPVEDAFLFVGFGVFAAVGSLLVARQPGNPVGWIMAAIGLIVSLFPAAEIYAAYVMTTRGIPDFLAVFGAWVNAWYWYPLLALALIYLPLYFPDGCLPSRRWWPIAVIAGIGTAGLIVLGALSDPLIGQNIDYRIDNPIGIEGMPMAEEHPLFPLFGSFVLVIGLLGATASMVVRYRRSRGVERQQLKWFLYAAMLLPLMAIADLVPVVGGYLFGLILVALPTAIGIAVLRYRLYDIDIIIRRTLMYGVLTALLALVYFGAVTLAGSLFSAVSHQQSSLAIVISTLAIAVLFSPLRRRVQDFIDRQFYRRKYDAEKALDGFAVRARDEVDAGRLTSTLVGVVEEAVQPVYVSIWVKDSNAFAQRREGLSEIPVLQRGKK